MEQSPSWEPQRSSASQEIPRTLYNTNVHYRIHKIPSSVHIFSQINPAQSHFLKIHPNIILPPTPGPSKRSLSFTFSPPKPRMHLSSPPHTCYMPSPSHFFHDFITRIVFGEEYRSLSSSLCNFLNSRITSSLLGPIIHLSTPLSNTLSLRSSVTMSDQVSHPHLATRKVIILYFLTIFRWQTWRQKSLHRMIACIRGRSLGLTGNILSQNKITKAFSKRSLKPAVNEILIQNLLNIWASLGQGY